MLLSACSPITASKEDWVLESRGFVIEVIKTVFDSFLQYILFTPAELFDTSSVKSLVLKFSAVSMATTTVLTMGEGLKRIIGAEYTPYTQVFKRFPIAIFISAFAPFLFYWAAKGSNILVDVVIALIGGSISDTAYFANELHRLGSSIYQVFITFVFLVVLLVYLCRIIFYHATRWFGLLFNCLATPLVMTAWIFKPYEHVLEAWLKDNKIKFLSQVGHSFFLGVISLVLFTPNLLPFASGIDIFYHFIFKIMIAIGGFYLMLNPPSWVKALISKEKHPRSILSTVTQVASIVGGAKGKIASILLRK